MKDLCIRESYTDSKNVEQVSWNKIGILIDGKNGKQYIKLFHIPNILINVFEQKHKNAPQVEDVDLNNATSVDEVELQCQR